MKFRPNKTPIEIIKEGAFGTLVLVLETSILVLIKNDTKMYGKNLFI